MAFFVKTSQNGSQWGWCYAENVHKTASSVTLNNAQQPVCGVTKHLSLGLGGKGEKIILPPDKGIINCFPISAPQWLKTPQSRPIRLPSTIPSQVRDRGEQAAFEYIWATTSLPRVFGREEIRLAIAEEMLLEQAEPFLRTPCFLPESEKDIHEWKAARPSAGKLAEDDATRLLSTLDLPPDIAALRRRLRMEAHRKLDMTYGREVMLFCPWLGGEPWQPMATQAGQLKMGRSSGGTFPTGSAIPPYSPSATNEDHIASIEAAIWPGDLDFSQKAKWLPWQRVFALFEENTPLPAIGLVPWTVTEDAPGFSNRISMDLLIELQCDPIVFARIGIPRWVSAPARQFLNTMKATPPESKQAAQWCLHRAWSASQRNAD